MTPKQVYNIFESSCKEKQVIRFIVKKNLSFISQNIAVSMRIKLP